MTSHAQDDPTSIVSRRRIVRTAATLAWTVPAIQLATSVPAFAGSGCCDLSVAGSASWRAGELNYIDVPLTIANRCAGSVTGMTLTLYVCGLSGITYSGAEVLPAGWVQAGAGNRPLTPDGAGCYTLVYTSGQTLAGNATTSPSFRLKTKDYNGGSRPGGSITATVSTAGCSSQSYVISLPAVG